MYINGLFPKKKHGSLITLTWEEFYDTTKGRAAFRDIQLMLAQDWAMLEKDGFLIGSTRLYPIVLGQKGDWSYLAPGRIYTGPLYMCVLFCFCFM